MKHTVTSNEARQHQGELASAVRHNGDQVIVTFRGKPILRWVPEDWYQQAEHALNITKGIANIADLDDRALRAFVEALKPKPKNE